MNFLVANVIYGQNGTKCTNPRQPISPMPHYSASYYSPSTSFSSPMPSSVAVQTTPPMQALDGCHYYQVLDEADRASNFKDWSSYRCDRELYGWYRFMGKAGNRLSTSCPSSAGYHYWCGSYYQGWIPSGGMPAQYQGVSIYNNFFLSYNTC